MCAGAEAAINRRIFETSLDLILVVSRRGDFIRVSPSAKEILGYDPAEMVGRNGVDFVHPPDLEATRDEMRVGRRSEERRVGKECVRTGRSRWSPVPSKTT